MPSGVALSACSVVGALVWHSPAHSGAAGGAVVV